MGNQIKHHSLSCAAMQCKDSFQRETFNTMIMNELQAGGASFTAVNKDAALETAGLPNFAVKLLKWMHDYGVLLR